MTIRQVKPDPGMSRPKASDLEVMQALIASGGGEDTLTIHVGDIDFDVTYRPLTWTQKSKCVTSAQTISSNEKGEGQLVFRLDIYNKMALKNMIVRCPVPLTDKLMDSWGVDVGLQFETIIPDPFSASNGVEDSKKEQTEFSEEA